MVLIYSLYIHYIFTIYLLYIHYMLTIYSLHIHHLLYTKQNTDRMLKFDWLRACVRNGVWTGWTSVYNNKGKHLLFVVLLVWVYNKALINLEFGPYGKYLLWRHAARTSLRSVRTSWRHNKYFHVWTALSVNKSIIFTIYSLHIHYICTYIFTIYSLHIHYISTIYSLYVHYIFTTYSLYIYYIFTIYSLYVHYIFTILRRWDFCRIFDSLLKQLQ